MFIIGQFLCLNIALNTNIVYRLTFYKKEKCKS